MPRHQSRSHARTTIDPTWADRFAHLWHPTHGRGDLIRRVIAALCVLAAAALALRGDPDAEHTTVLVASRDLPPGTVLSESDLRPVDLARSTLPDGTLHTLADIAGRTVAGPVRAGETLTDLRLLGPRLAAAAAGSDDAAIVPLELADATVADVLREGDVVDVLAVATSGAHSETTYDPEATVVATGAVVVLVNRSEGGRERLVLLALPRDKANAVAVTSLTHAVTVTLH